MSKINVSINIKNNEETKNIKVPAIIQENVLKYKEDNDTIARFNYQNNSLFRENHELRMEYQFNIKKATTGKIYIKDLKKDILVTIKTKQLERQENAIKIVFTIENNEFIYQIEVIK